MKPSRLRGVTLIELMVVVGLIAVLSLIFFALLGTFSGGDPLRRAASGVTALLQRGRSASLSRASRFEVLVDFANHTIWPLERVPLHFFSFESESGSIGSFLELGSNFELSDANPPMLQGKALESFSGGTSTSGFTLNVQGDMGPDDGLVMRCDLRLDLNPGETGRIINLGGAGSLHVDAVVGASAWLRADIGDTTIMARNAVPTRRWTTIELMMSPLGSRLYVNGIPSTKTESGISPGNIFVASPNRSRVEIGNPSRSLNFLMDNLRIERLNAADKLELDDQWNIKLLPPGADVMQVAEDRVWKAGSEAINLNTLLAAEAGIGPLRAAIGESLVAEPPQAAMIFFDRQGMLDGHWHDAEVRLALLDIASDVSTIRRLDVVISASGDVRIQPQITTVNRALPEPEENGIPITGKGRTK